MQHVLRKMLPIYRSKAADVQITEIRVEGTL